MSPGEQEQVVRARCPECDARITFPRLPDIDQMIVCPECETRLKVVRTSPLRLYWASEDESYADGRLYVEDEPD